LSRTKAAELVAAGEVTLDGQAPAKSDRVHPGAFLEVRVPAPQSPVAIVPETVGDQFERLMCSLAPQIAIEQKAVASTMPRTPGELRDEIDFLEARLRMLREQLDLLSKSAAPAAVRPDAEAR